MTLPNRYNQIFLPVRSFLASSRALSDGQRAVQMLNEELSSEQLMLSDWKVHWVAACSLLRAAIELFKVDKELCFAPLALGVKQEWEAIAANKESHAIYWEFLREERNNILHEYKWSAFERFLDREGEILQQRPSLLILLADQYDRDLVIRDGPYKGRKAIEVIQECQQWVEARILSAIRRAGLEPTEERNIVTFETRGPVSPSLIGGTGQGSLGK